MLNFAVVALEGHAVEQTAAEGHAARACDRVREVGGAHGGGIRSGGADENRAAGGQTEPRDQRAHRVADEEIGQVGVALAHQLVQMEHIGNQIFPAVMRGEKAEVGRTRHRSAVADVVVAADDEAESAQIFRERGITHSVADLHDAADMGILGYENIIGDIGNAVRAFINILCTFYIHKQHVRSQR